MRDNAKAMEPRLAGGGWKTAGGAGVTPDSRSVKKVTATKMDVGREACIERIHIMKFMRMVIVASGSFCPFGHFCLNIFYPNSVS